MLRACHRVLKPGGRLAFTVIHATPHLSPEEHVRALAAAPTFAGSEAPYPDLLERTGFRQVVHHDVTKHFSRIVEAWLTEVLREEDAARRIWGDANYDDTVARRRATLSATRDGLIRRSLLVAVQ